MVDNLPPDPAAPSSAPQGAEPAANANSKRPGQNVVPGAGGVASSGRPVDGLSSVSPAEPARTALPTGLPPEKKPFLSKKMWALLLLLLLFLGVGGFAPVQNIPVLSSLARAMGYSDEQMASISFLKALLFWADDERGPAERIAKNSFSVFSTRAGRFDALTRGAGAYGAVGDQSSSLINLRAVNASLRQQGKTTDALSGAAAPAGEDDSVKGVRFNRGGINGLSKDARASAEVQPDMYYGTETGVVARDPKNAFDGTADLKKLKANIIGSSASDWKNDILRKAMLEETSGLDKKLGGGSAAMLNLENAGRSLTDFRYVWLTSQASRRAQQLPLKKTLAAAGFFGEELPQQIFTATGGVAMAGLEADDVVADVGNAKLQEKRQRECEEAAKTYGSNINNTVGSIANTVNSLQGTFPNFPGDCGNPGKVNAWRAALADVRNSCKGVKGNYDKLNESCMMEFAYKPNREGQCTTLNLDDKLNEFEKACAAYAEYQAAQAAAQAEAERTGEPVKEVNMDDYVHNPEQFDPGQVKESVQGTFNIPVWGGSSGSSTPNDFFPETDLSETKNWSYLDNTTGN